MTSKSTDNRCYCKRWTMLREDDLDEAKETAGETKVSELSRKDVHDTLQGMRKTCQREGPAKPDSTVSA